MDSAGSYNPYLDDHRGDTDYGETEECSNICLQSDRGSNYEEEVPMEVEEYPHRDLPSHGDAKSSESKEPPAPKALSRARRPGASRLTQVASREAPLSDTPPSEAKSSRAYAPTPKPRAGKKAAEPEPGQSLLPRLARDTSCQAGQSSSQPTTGGLVGGPSPFPGLVNRVRPCVFHRLGPCPSPATLLTLARSKLSGPPPSPFGVGLRAAARQAGMPGVAPLRGALSREQKRLPDLNREKSIVGMGGVLHNPPGLGLAPLVIDGLQVRKFRVSDALC
ncbi:hypothetical protein P4O66_003736 [Electrophorus voltai]|uniref:Uncharacterized protein n=1 Tax=Electrophorus voltai TaxID=2609070 RepID=A0AAD8ZRG0_9TELE|nr:hypothetical protein P4O66_003736 [Electrophorus voltai]